MLESRRPISLHNIYDGTNVRVLAYEAEVEDWRVPDHQHIFSADSDNEEEDDDASLSGDSDNDDEEIDGEDDGESFLGEGSESGGGPPRRKRRRRKTRRSEEDEEEEESSESLLSLFKIGENFML